MYSLEIDFLLVMGAGPMLEVRYQVRFHVSKGGFFLNKLRGADILVNI